MNPDSGTAQAVAVPQDDAEAFEDFFRAEYANLVRVAMSMTSVSIEAAKDAAEEAMVKVFERWSDIENPAGYGRTAVVHHAIDRLRRDNKRLPLELKGGHLTPEADPCTQLHFWEQQQWITQLLDTLPPAQRDAMEDAYEGLTTAESARRRGKTEATIRKNRQWARQRLKPLLNQDYQIAQEEQPIPPVPAAREEETR